MNELSVPLDERARKIARAVLQALSHVGQVQAAKAMGVSEPTVSRLKAEHVENFAKLLTALDLKVVPASAKCYAPEHIKALQYFARVGMTIEHDGAELSFDDPE